MKRALFSHRSTRAHRAPSGLRQCRTCGHIYTARAMVCPVCHNDYSTLFRTARRTPSTVIVDFPSFLPLPAPTFPAWLIAFDHAIAKTPIELSTVAKNPAAPQVVRDMALATLCLRYRQPLTALKELAAVETEVTAWLTRHHVAWQCPQCRSHIPMDECDVRHATKPALLCPACEVEMVMREVTHG